MPVFGFWMIPLGLFVLSVDIPIVRRWRRQLAVRGAAFQSCACNDLAVLDTGRAGYRAGGFRSVMTHRGRLIGCGS